jgi:putative spermidine/putrescine transport system permease protein
MVGRFLLLLVSAAALAFLLLPILVIVGGSVTTEQALSFPPTGMTLGWYRQILSDKDWVAAIFTSTQLAIAATAVAVPLATMAALGLSRSDTRLSHLLRELFVAPLVLPHIVLGGAILQVSALAGFAQTFGALLIGHIVIVMPFVVQSVLPLLSKHERILAEASFDLGADKWQTFRYVTLPHIEAGLITGSIFAFIFSWINVELSLFQTTPDTVTVPVKIFNYVQYQVDPLIAAVSSLTIFIAAAAIIALEVLFGLDILPKNRARKET